ncbi:MAG: elongation factor P [Planctomycetes bacterium]|nr:elongation factor P [Planctomycetota bacterium]
MAVRSTELRKGTVIIGQRGELLLITEYMHHTPGNLRAVIHMKVRNIQTGQSMPMRLSSSDSFEVAYLDKKKCEYLYKDSSGYVFMDQASFEQFPLQEDLVGDKMGFVRENTVVDVTFHDALAIGVELPTTVVLKVVEAEIAARGDTATNVKKDAVLETGLKIRVPSHIKAGEDVKISTADGEFQGRA